MTTWLITAKANTLKRGKKGAVWTMENMNKIFQSTSPLSKAFEYLLATGNLSSKTGLVTKVQKSKQTTNINQKEKCSVSFSLCEGLGMLQNTGLCVVADKLNFIRYLSHFRCVHRGAAFAKMRTTSVRKLLPESWGFLCPVHTPDGEPCGLMNHMTASCEIVTQTLSTFSLPALLCSLGERASQRLGSFQVLVSLSLSSILLFAQA